MGEISATEENKKKGMKEREDSLRDLWDIKRTNILTIGTQEEEKGPEKMCEGIIVENIPNMGKETVT